MSSDSPSPLQITFTPEFQRNLRQLAKKYRRIRLDLQPTLDQVASGGKPGDQVPGVDYEVFKVRIRNSDASRGKSGGYRLIYFAKSETEVVLVAIYSKTEQADISHNEIRYIIASLETSPSPDQQPNEPESNASADPPGD